GSEGANHLQAGRGIGHGLQLEAARCDLTGLVLKGLYDVRDWRWHVLPLQIEHGNAEMAVEAVRLILQSYLGLLACFRQEQLVRSVEADDRIVAGRVGDVGRKAVGEIVDQAGTSAELAVLAVEKRVASRAIALAGRYPVITAAQHQREAAELHLVLNIGAELILGQEEIAERRARERNVADAINRIEHIDRGNAAKGKDLIVVDPVAFQVEPEQHRVLHRAGIETILQLVV